MFNYLTCAQHKENVNEFLCESQKWQRGKVASHQVKTKQTTVLFLKDLRRLKFPPKYLYLIGSNEEKPSVPAGSRTGFYSSLETSSN